MRTKIIPSAALAALLALPTYSAQAQLEQLVPGSGAKPVDPALTGGPAIAKGPVGASVSGPTVRISVGPPQNQNDVKAQAPSPRHLWLPGYWNWQGDHHVWVKGHWEAPKENVVYLAPQWVFQGRLWTFYPGHWARVSTEVPKAGIEDTAAAPPPGSNVVVKLAPPPHRVEILPDPPSPQHKWVPGHWIWQDNNFVWNAGFWTVPRAGVEWAPAHWLQAGKEWRFVPGYWHKK